MDQSKNNRLKETPGGKCTGRPNGTGRSALYNYDRLQGEIMRAKEGFAGRLYSLRSAKKISARRMSLSLGQGTGYINNIENGHGMPSMEQFFAICEFLEVSPAEFFSYAEHTNIVRAELYETLDGLTMDDISLLMSIAKRMKK